MSTFKQFISEVQGVGGAYKFYTDPTGSRGKQLYSGLPYTPTSALSNRYNALMSPRRRQLIDDDEPGQKYQYYIVLIRILIADVDTGKLIAGHSNDPYKVVYTQSDMNKVGYNFEEQKKIEELEIFKWTTGYDHRELVKEIGANDLDKIRKFRHGDLFDPKTHPDFIEREGYFVDLDKISSVRDSLEKWVSYQDALERGLQVSRGGLGSAIAQGASMNRFNPSPSVTGV